MHARLRTILLALTAVGLSIAATSVADDIRDTANRPSTGEPAVLSLQGKGRQATSKFKLSKGLAIIRTTYHGPSNYIVGLMNAQGDHVLGLFNQIDNYEGARGFEIPKDGEYLLNVQSEGPWTFTVEQPRPQHGERVPQAIGGNRSDVSPFFELNKGLSVFKFNYQGEGRFIATLVDQDGRALEQLVNNLNQFEASAPFKVPHDGIYFLNVTADGPWHIEIE